MVQKAIDPRAEERKREARRPLASRLIRARERANFANRTEFASALRVAPNTVYRIERCLISPSVETLKSWARTCGVSVDDLLGTGASADHGGEERKARDEAAAE